MPNLIKKIQHLEYLFKEFKISILLISKLHKLSTTPPTEIPYSTPYKIPSSEHFLSDIIITKATEPPCFIDELEQTQ